MANREVELQVAPGAAWEQLKNIAGDLGKIEEASESARFLVFKARYGLNPVRLRVSVLSTANPDSARLEVQARGQDIWGVASRKTMDRLIAGFG